MTRLRLPTVQYTRGLRMIAHRAYWFASVVAVPRDVGRHPGHCLLVTAPSAHHTTPHHTGSGLPLDWFDSDPERHITAHHMDNIPTMTVLAHRSSHRDTVLDTTCLLCGAQPETAPHLWACLAQSHEWEPASRRLAEWLD